MHYRHQKTKSLKISYFCVRFDVEQYLTELFVWNFHTVFHMIYGYNKNPLRTVFLIVRENYNYSRSKITDLCPISSIPRQIINKYAQMTHKKSILVEYDHLFSNMSADVSITQLLKIQQITNKIWHKTSTLKTGVLFTLDSTTCYSKEVLKIWL